MRTMKCNKCDTDVKPIMVMSNGLNFNRCPACSRFSTISPATISNIIIPRENIYRLTIREVEAWGKLNLLEL